MLLPALPRSINHRANGKVSAGSCDLRETFRGLTIMASKAIELDDLLAEAHRAMGTFIFLGQWDWTRADQEISRAIDFREFFIAESFNSFTQTPSKTSVKSLVKSRTHLTH